MTKLYQNIKYLCKANKITIAELERRLKIPPTTISSWRIKMPLCERVQLIADYFDVSVDFLIGRCDNSLSHKQTHSTSTAMLIEISEKLNLDKDATNFVIQFMQNLKQFIK